MDTRTSNHGLGGKYRHIILPLGRMPIQIPLPIHRRQPIQRIAHILAHLVIPVLVERQPAARVLDEQVQQADFVVAEFGEFGGDVVGDEVAAAGARGKSKRLLKPGHVACCLVCFCFFRGCGCDCGCVCRGQYGMRGCGMVALGAVGGCYRCWRGIRDIHRTAKASRTISQTRFGRRW